MKAIVRNSDFISLYVFDDSEHLIINDDNIIVGYPAKIIINDCNNGNVSIVSGIDIPTDWKGGKYFYKNGEWSINPDYQDLTLQEDI